MDAAGVTNATAANKSPGVRSAAMACLTCYVVILVSGSGHMPSEAEPEFWLRLRGEPDASPDEAAGIRELFFEGDVVRTKGENGSLLVQGELVGNFSRPGDEEIRQTAMVEVFSRDGEVALLHVTVEGEFAGPSVAMTLKPSESDSEVDEGEIALGGWIFTGRQE